VIQTGALNQAIDIQPLVWIILNRAWTYQQMGEYGSALRDLDAVIDTVPDYVEAYGARDSLFLMARFYDQALADFDHAYELQPENTQWLASRMGVLIAKQDWAGARRTIERLEQLPDYFRQSQLAQRNLVKFSPEVLAQNLVRYVQPLGGSAGDAQRIAMQQSRSASSHQETFPNTLRVVKAQLAALELVDHGQFEQALDTLDKAIELVETDPNLSKANATFLALVITMRGGIYVTLERYEEALADLDRAVGPDPDFAFARSWRGEAYLLTGRYGKAVIDFDRVVQIAPDNDWVLYKQACAYKAANQEEEASAGLKSCISIARGGYEEDPQDWRNTCNLALYHLLANETEAARHLYQEALDGGVLLHPNTVSEAIQDLDNFLVVFPDHDDAKTLRDSLERGYGPKP
jgi:tetratricopeptide (TPR) repeat protein